MKTILKCLGYMLLTAMVAAVTAIIVARKVRVSERETQVREEFGWAYHLLSTDGQPDRMREHLKARVYYWGMFMPTESLKRFPRIDFGPVDEKLLGAMLAAPPHADSPNDFYRDIMDRVRRDGPNHTSDIVAKRAEASR